MSTAPCSVPADVALDADVDHAADVAAVADAEPARVEVDLVDEVGGEHRRSGQEVIEDGDRLAADEHAGVARVGAAHDEQPEAERRARDAGHVLQHPQRIADRPRDGRQLGLGQRLPGLFGVLGAGAHARLVERRGRARGCSRAIRPGSAPPSSAAEKSRTQGSCAVSDTMTRRSPGGRRGGPRTGRRRRSAPTISAAASPPPDAAPRRIRATSAPTSGSRVPRSRIRPRTTTRAGARRGGGDGASGEAARGAVRRPRRRVGRCAAVDRDGLGLEMDGVFDPNRATVCRRLPRGRTPFLAPRQRPPRRSRVPPRPLTATAVTRPSAAMSMVSVTSPAMPRVQRVRGIARLRLAS